MFDMPFGMAPPVPAPEPEPSEAAPPPPVLPTEPARALMAARPTLAFGPGAPPLHALPH